MIVSGVNQPRVMLTCCEFHPRKDDQTAWTFHLPDFRKSVQ